jgi:hypothetical protein
MIVLGPATKLRYSVLGQKLSKSVFTRFRFPRKFVKSEQYIRVYSNLGGNFYAQEALSCTRSLYRFFG